MIKFAFAHSCVFLYVLKVLQAIMFETAPNLTGIQPVIESLGKNFFFFLTILSLNPEYMAINYVVAVTVLPDPDALINFINN